MTARHIALREAKGGSIIAGFEMFECRFDPRGGGQEAYFAPLGRHQLNAEGEAVIMFRGRQG